MKEVMAIIRMNMVNPTKTALAGAGFPAFSCRKCLGRGKKSVDMAVVQSLLETGETPMNPVGEHLTESHRLIAKRLFTIMVDDGQVGEVVRIIIETNQTGNPGDGKIFILPIMEAYTVRTGESTKDAY
ncbi:nitrogen regulatory protein P-II family [Sporobacter termitidis DSM 10068]|uniref:Nitrogen regulatory protein P-II family n=1 Tax=Sporobacter termitidis DSM 10068 TaxID=1123282 RepID=A0A1M5XKC5_9FIRM|nr:P-II family nitrogen regulator [Sporobacter termitidis]SHH99703.1 nitrogen regulatory protein P-II family [Sporobacter termitidis DSM 10068]